MTGSEKPDNLSEEQQAGVVWRRSRSNERSLNAHMERGLEHFRRSELCECSPRKRNTECESSQLLLPQMSQRCEGLVARALRRRYGLERLAMLPSDSMLNE